MRSTTGIVAVAAAPPAFAVVDMRLEDGNGLDVDRRAARERARRRAPWC